MRKILLAFLFLLLPAFAQAANYTWYNNSKIQYTGNATNWTLTLKDANVTPEWSNVQNKTTTGLTEGSNLYFTTTRAEAATLGLTNLTDAMIANMNASDFQPADADLTDLADGSLTGSKVGNNGSIQNIVLANSTADEGINSRINLIPGSGITVVGANSSYGYNYTIGSSAGGGNVSQAGAVSANNFAAWSADNTIKDLGVSNATFVLASAANVTNDQNLNTTSNVTFNNVTATNINGTSITAAYINATTASKGVYVNASTAMFSPLFNGTTAVSAPYVNGTTAVAGVYVNATTAMNSLGYVNGSTVVASVAINLPEGGLQDSTVVSADIKDSTIASADIADWTIVGADITNETINSSKITNFTVVDDDITNTTLTDLKRKELNIQFTVEEPDLLSNATGMPVRSTIIWSNTDTRLYTIAEVKSISDIDNYNFSLLKSVNYTNVTAAAETYLQNVSVADNWEGCFGNNTTSLTNATIESGKHLIFQGNETANATKVHVIIKGNFS